MGDGRWHKVLCAGYCRSGGLDFQGTPVSLPGQPMEFQNGLINRRQAPYAQKPQQDEQIVVEVEIEFERREFRLLRWGYRYSFDVGGGSEAELVNFYPFMSHEFRPIIN